VLLLNSVYFCFVIDSVRKLLDTPSYILHEIFSDALHLTGNFNVAWCRVTLYL